MSLTLEERLTEHGFVCSRQQLAATAQDTFAFNIELYFGAAADTDSLQISAENALSNSRNVLIFDFAQEDVYEHFDAVISYLQRLKDNPHTGNTLVLFAAQERSLLQPQFSGTDIFAQNFTDADYAAAIAVSFAEKTRILTGNRTIMTPLWLTQQLTAAFYAEDVAYTFAHRFTSLYRLGFLRGETREAAFIRNAIPAATVEFGSDRELGVLAAFAEQFSQEQTALWDSHYIFIPLPAPFKPLWIGETFFFSFSLLLGTLFLLILCSFSFVGENGADYKKDFKRSWYLIPLTLAITCLSFTLGQKICASIPLLRQAMPIVQFGVKLICALIFISVLFAMQEYFKISSIQFTHGYFIYLLGIGNIFIFSAIDISFFLTFLAEYFFIYIARKSTRIVPLIVSVVLMLIPLAPYVYYLIRDGQRFDLQRFVFSPWIYNMLLALLIAPFLIMWLRMLVRLEIYAAIHNFSFKNMLLHGSVSTGIIIGITVVVITGLSLFSRSATKNTPFRIPEAIEDNRDSFTIIATRDTFQGMTTHHITITAQEAAVHYAITISAATALPLFDATYDYTIQEETMTAVFVVPDYPPETMTIDYASEASTETIVTISAWYETDTAQQLRKETRTVALPGTL